MCLGSIVNESGIQFQVVFSDRWNLETSPQIKISFFNPMKVFKQVRSFQSECPNHHFDALCRDGGSNVYRRSDGSYKAMIEKGQRISTIEGLSSAIDQMAKAFRKLGLTDPLPLQKNSRAD